MGRARRRVCLTNDLDPPTVADPNAGLSTLASRLGEELCSLVEASNCVGQAASNTV